MSARLLLLCPGQGGQHAGMFDLARARPAGAALLERLAPLLPQLPDGGAGWHANRHAQPLVVAATLAMWAALADATPAPALVAGYSVGELSAWSVAGALDPVDAVALAVRRAELMDLCVRDGAASIPLDKAPPATADACAPGHAMVAFSGLPAGRAAALAAPLGGHLAIRNGADSGVLGLPAAHADALQGRLAAAGARPTRLPVEVASHTPYMQAAVQPYADALAASALRDAPCAVLSGATALRLSSRAQAVEHLSRQLAHPIDWAGCMDACGEAGITVALELGPGNALARMMQARHPHIPCRSVADFRSVDGILAWLARCG
jgi:[acyl-carrier-protein] S-malonyltransferase